ncbi:hypothetical protein AB0F72_10910 [Actinoplanes sp. NPDC023936]|uniref:hypothetical protein n=1 Tax=Actinoplanes sp. NPDC023936 TaxID=3154910 RepID=UPI0033D2B38D
MLNDHYGWRITLLVLAAYGTLAIPLHTLVIRRPPATAQAHHHRASAHARAATIRTALRDGWLWLLAGGFAAHAAAMSAMTRAPSRLPDQPRATSHVRRHRRLTTRHALGRRPPSAHRDRPAAAAAPPRGRRDRPSGHRHDLPALDRRQPHGHGAHRDRLRARVRRGQPRRTPTAGQPLRHHRLRQLRRNGLHPGHPRQSRRPTHRRSAWPSELDRC